PRPPHQARARPRRRRLRALPAPPHSRRGPPAPAAHAKAGAMIVVGKTRPACGCIKLAGCRPAGMRGMGDVTPERLKGEWDRILRETSAKFSRPLTFAQLYKELLPHLERTDRNVG